MLQETLPRPIEAFLRNCQVSGVPRLEFRSVKARYSEFIENWNDVMKIEAAFKTIAEKGEKRVATGEDPELVMADLEAEFMKIYSDEPPDSNS